jgi:hypothetical protein
MSAHTTAPTSSGFRTDTYEGIKMALRVFKTATESAHVPGGAAAADGLLQILAIVEAGP